MGRLALLAISQLFVDQFLRICNLKFENITISDSFMAHSRVLGGGGILGDYRELSFCCPCFFKSEKLKDPPPNL